MSWRTRPEAVPSNPRDFAEKIDALGWKGVTPRERRLALRAARAISALLPEWKGKGLLARAGIRSQEWVPSAEKRGGKYALIEKIKAKALKKRLAHQGVPEPAADLTATVRDVREERIAKLLESSQDQLP